MITENNIDNLYRIVSNLSWKDFKQANPKPKMNSKGETNYKPYFLSDETQEAQRFYSMSIRTNVTREQEEQIKIYLLKIKLSQPELLKQTNGNYEQWKRVRTA